MKDKYVAYSAVDCEYETFETFEEAAKWLAEGQYAEAGEFGFSQESMEGDDYIAKITHRSKFVETDRKENYHVHTDECEDNDCDLEEWPYDNAHDSVGEIKMEAIDDSLAVEVPEAKSGAIEKKYIDSRIELETEYKTGVTEIVDNYRSYAERYIAQLQADKEALKKQVVKLTDEAVGMGVAIKQFKGALRTLAIGMVKQDFVSLSHDTNVKLTDEQSKSEKIRFEKEVQKVIDYALAHPTEEVEG